jgi:hypothetical protein
MLLVAARNAPLTLSGTAGVSESTKRKICMMRVKSRTRNQSDVDSADLLKCGRLFTFLMTGVRQYPGCGQVSIPELRTLARHWRVTRRTFSAMSMMLSCITRYFLYRHGSLRRAGFNLEHSHRAPPIRG